MSRHVYEALPIAAPAIKGADIASRWQQQQQRALRQLASLAWPQAQREYALAQGLAEQLLIESTCKGCAIKAYIRTLIEYALVLHKVEQLATLRSMRLLSLHSLQALLGRAKAVQLLQPLADIQRATPAQVELWLGRMLLGSANTSVKH